MENVEKKDLSDNNIVTFYDNNIDKFLEEKKSMINKDTWIKLDKTTKIKKLYDFVDNYYINKEKLNDTMITDCKKFLIEMLEKKKFTRNKDVIYDKEKAQITSIPHLNLNGSVFSLTNERRVSTLKSLPSFVKTKKNKQKISKTSDNK